MSAPHKISDETLYLEFRTHLRYLNDKMIEAFNLFIKLASSIVAGAFYLQWKMTPQDPQRMMLARGADALMFLAAIGMVVIILNNLRSWLGYRKALSREFPQICKPPDKFSWLAEAFMCVLIFVTPFVFLWINPL